MNNYKKVLAGILTTSLVLGNSMIAFAGEGGRSTGSGQVEGSVVEEIFSVVLPTEAEVAGTFDYILDPMKLIQESKDDKYSAYEFGAADTLFFANKPNASSGKMQYSSTSNGIVVENRSNADVKLTVTLKASKVDGITFTNDSTFNSNADTDTSLYLGLAATPLTDGTPGTPDAEKGINTNGVVVISPTINALAGDGTNDPFIIKWNPIRNAYEYVENPACTHEVSSYEFKVHGICNENAAKTDWIETLESGESPELEVVWSIENPHGPQVTFTSDGQVTMTDFTAKQNYKSISLTADDSTFDLSSYSGDIGTWTTGTWTAENGGDMTLDLSSAWKSWMSGKATTVTVYLTDGTSRSATVIGD